MKKYSLCIIFILIFSFQSLAGSLEWKESDIVGHGIKLIDKQKIEAFYFFSDNNLVVATIGKVGSKTATSEFWWEWEIDKNGILIIKDDNGKIWYKMKKLYNKNGIIGVELSGKKVEYEVKHKPVN